MLKGWLIDLLHNKVLFSAAGGWLAAQLIKVLYDSFRNGFNPKRIGGAGGMPSTHSSTVSALAASVGITEGGGSSAFVIAVIMAFVVMYDAQGVRYNTGINSRMLNILDRERAERGQDKLLDHELDENIGHTLPEIIAGMIIGILTAFTVCHFMP